MRRAKRNRIRFGLVVALMGAALLAACGGDEERKQAEQGSAQPAAPEQFVEETAAEKVARAEREALEEKAREEKREEKRRRERRSERRREREQDERKPRGPKPLELRITVLDDTKARTLKRVEIEPRNGEAWKPNLIFGTDTRAMSAPARTLFIYPDGRKGKQIALRLEPPPALDRSKRQSLTITISDRTVRVIGSLVKGIEKRFPRR